MRQVLILGLLLVLSACASTSQRGADKDVAPVPKKGHEPTLGVVYESQTASRRIAAGTNKTFGNQCSMGKVVGGGYSGISVMGDISVDEIRVVASYPGEPNNSWILHVRNIGTPSAGSAPLVTVLVTVACLTGL